MGDPRKIRKSYETPRHPWVASRIEDEKALRREYGLGTKKEIHKMGSTLKQFKDRAKSLIARRDKQAEVEQQQLLARMARLGLVKPGASFDEILGLGLKDVMNRRLQSVLLKQHLARSPKQARQMITHRHVSVNGNVITSPGHMVTVEDEGAITFATRSPFGSPDHKERFSEEELEKKRQREEAKRGKADKDEEEPIAFSEKEIEEAEVLTGEKKVETVAEKEEKPAEQKPTEKPTEAAEAETPAKQVPEKVPKEKPVQAAENADKKEEPAEVKQ